MSKRIALGQRGAKTSQGDSPPVQLWPGAVLLQGVGISEVFILVEAGLRYMKDQCLKTDQFARLKAHRDILAQAHDDRMSSTGHEFAEGFAPQSHSNSQDGDDWMSIADVAAELSLTARHVRRLAPALGGVRIGATWVVKKAPVLALKSQRERSR